MKRKDGQPKIRSPRNLPEFDGGLKDHFSQRPRFDKTTKVVSFFSGCGGLDLGLSGGFEVLGRNFEALPFETVSAHDILSDAVKTYRLNLGDEIHECDLSKSDMASFQGCDLVVGGFPCQDFSSSGPKVGLDGERGQLYTVIRDYLYEHRPKMFLAENVPYLMRLGGGKYISQIVSEFSDCGYRVAVWELNCPDFGLPQSRKRIFIVGVRDDLKGFPRKPVGEYAQKIVPIDEAIEDLAEITGEEIPNQSQFFMASRATAGGGQGDHANQAGKVAYCIRANARGRIQFHYRLDRRLTVRECARLQSFPDKFVFPFSTQRNLTLIGNAVPPIVGHAVGKSISNYLQQLDNEGDLSDFYCSDWHHEPEQASFAL